MQTIVDLTGLRSITASEIAEALPGGPPAGSILLTARRAGQEVIILLPREVALSLHQGLDPWVRAIQEENDHGPSPSIN